MTLTVSNRLCSALKLADAIIENTNDIVEASALVVNGETLLCGDAEALGDCLEKRRTAFETNGAGKFLGIYQTRSKPKRAII